MSRPSIPPAQGERNAITGYSNQYKVSAFLILRALRMETLSRIRIADPNAGRVDDFQIFQGVKLDAYQIKWECSGGYIGFRDLIRPINDKPCLIAQLADGWQRLKAINPEIMVIVHLLTNQTSSTQDHPPKDTSHPVPGECNFRAFLQEVWNPIKSGILTIENIPECWLPAWNALYENCSFLDDSFQDFISNLEFDFRYNLPDFSILTPADSQIFIQDLDRVQNEIFNLVGNPDNIVELTKEDLLNRLGWKRRVEFSSRHEFTRPSIPYVPNEAVINKIETVIDALPGGYIGLIGAPGSGKSTLLSETYRYRFDWRIIHYYAFIPYSPEPVSLRGESVNFFHDITLAIDRLSPQFRVGESISKRDRDQLLTRFHQQIRLLSDDWQQSGKKTLIIIDGLDHVPREANPDRSFLKDLPLPEQIPNGIYLILGSQTDILRDLPPQVQYAIQQPDHRIEMSVLDSNAIHLILEQTDLADLLNFSMCERIANLSGGLPLILVYILKQIQNCETAEEIKTIIDAGIEYTGNIESYYAAIWHQIEDDPDIVHILAKIARIRGYIDFGWVQTWASYEDLQRLSGKIAHFFREEPGSRWYFFHNSFLQFLLTKTAEGINHAFDQSIQNRLYSELADHCADTDSRILWKFDELYYRIQAKQYYNALELATQDYFRLQFLNFRPISIIISDIKLALRVAIQENNIIALTRLILANAEIEQRDFYLDKREYIRLLFLLGNYNLAIENIIEGNDLRIPPLDAISLCPDLIKFENFTLANKIFNLLEPHNILSGDTSIDIGFNNSEFKILDCWASIAPYFRKLEEILNVIENAQFSIIHSQNIENPRLHLINQLYYSIGQTLIRQERWEEVGTICQHINREIEGGFFIWFYLNRNVWNKLYTIDEKKSKEFFTGVRGEVNEREHPQLLLNLAAGALFIGQNSQDACSLIQTVPNITLDRMTLMDVNPINLIGKYVTQYRIRFVCGLETTPREILLKDEWEEGEILQVIEDILYNLIFIWSQEYLHQNIDLATIRDLHEKAIQVFNHSLERLHDYWEKRFILDIRKEIYGYLLKTVGRLDNEFLEELKECFLQEWNNPEYEELWPISLRRQITIYYWKSGGSKKWTIDQIHLLQQKMSFDQSVDENIEECLNQAKALLILEDRENSQDLLRQMLQNSFGVGYRKDYQMDDWLKWLPLINPISQENIIERVEFFTRAITALESSTEGRASWFSALLLLQFTFEWYPRRTIRLMKWFIEKGILQGFAGIIPILQRALSLDNSVLNFVKAFLLEFLLPLYRDANSELILLILNKVMEIEGRERAIKSAHEIESFIDIFTLPAHRRNWKEGIARFLINNRLDFDGFGFNEDILYQKSDTHTAEVLELNDGSKLQIYQVLPQILSFEDFLRLKNLESPDSIFDWSPIIENLMENLNLKQTQEIIAIFKDNDRSGKIKVILSRILSKLGDPQRAWELAEIAFKSTRPGGWDDWFDGGKRYATCEALLQADVSRARLFLTNILERELNSDEWYPYSLATNINKVLPLLIEDVPYSGIWAEIQKYVHQLFQNFPLEQIEIPNLQELVPDDTIFNALQDLILIFMSHPSFAISTAIQRLCVRLLREREPIGTATISNALTLSEETQIAALSILKALGNEDLNLIIPFRDLVENLKDSPHYTIRRLVNYIGEKFLGN